MSLNAGNLILALDYNNLKAMIDNELGPNRRNLASYTSPTAVEVNDLTLASQINPLINGLSAINEDLVTVSNATAHQTILYSISNLNTVVTTLNEKPKEGTDSGCKSDCMNLCQGCTGSCESGCTTTCSGTCSGGCSGGCTSYCTSCQGCTSCSGGCAGGCQGCSGSCGGCGTDCRAGCSVNCAEGCQINIGLN